jgi:murein DD-endopeptidase MepM/ murein hydrolase activator NlpD
MRRMAMLGVLAWVALVAAAAPPTVSVAARALQPGEVVELTVQTGAPVDRVAVTAFGEARPAFRVGPSTWRTLIGIDLDTRPGTHDVRIERGPAGAAASVSYPLVVTPKSFPTRRLTVAEGYVNPPAAVQDRIVSEARRLTALWAHVEPVPRWSGPFVRPVGDRANSAFGSRSILNGQPRSPHGGADFLSPAGTPVHAPNDGIVVLVDDLYYTGNTVVIDHGVGLISLFAHLSSTAVAEGDLVHAGDIVGQVGSTGRVTGPHLHWTVRLGGARVDPLSLLAVED